MEIDDDRYATQRGRYLAKTTELRLPEAKTVAYSERGYSHYGIAKRLDTTESTVKTYAEGALALYGLEIMETLLPDEEPADYEQVESGYHRSLKGRSKETSFDFIRRHGDSLP